MIQKDKYFDLLFQYLYDGGLLPVNDGGMQSYDLQKYFEKAEIDITIISEMREQYGIGFEKVFLINCKKNALLCDNFHVIRDRMLIQTAVYFTVLGCLLDHLLDHGNEEQKREASEKLNWDYCQNYFLKETMAKDTSVIDSLYEKISHGMQRVFKCNEKRFEFIVSLIKRAADAEEQVNCSGYKYLQKDVVINKSVIFVKVAIEILLCDKVDISEQDRNVIEELGYAFALIDDLCDLYEDMETGQMNIFMEYEQQFETDGEKILKFALQELNNKLGILKKNMDKRLFEFVLQEIRDWSMSSVELKTRIWRWLDIHDSFA